MAKDGDVPAARYLLDRIFGRPAALPQPPAADRTIPYSTEELARDLFNHDRKLELHRQHRLKIYTTPPYGIYET